jgi:hypothetical protein
MVTLTFQHDREDKLTELRRSFCDGRYALKTGKAWTLFRKRWGMVGSTSSTETTYGLSNGFHLHDHSLYLLESIPDTQELREDLSRRFEKIMRDLGRYVSPEIGVHVRTTDKGAADYISKWGAAFEMTKATVKDGRGIKHYNMFEILYLAGTGVTWAAAVFREYAEAMRGVNQIRWSPGLRRLLGLGIQPTDAELVEAVEEDDRLLASLTLKQWGIVLKREKRGELIEVASSGDHGLLRAYLLSLGIVLPNL